MFPWDCDRVLLCDIEDRGWSIPSGRVEPNESSIEAAAREAREEAGAILRDILYIGCYRITDREEVRWADVFAARVDELVELPKEFESVDRRFYELGDVPPIYHLWNELTEAVFIHSREELRRHSLMLDCLEGGH